MLCFCCTVCKKIGKFQSKHNFNWASFLQQYFYTSLCLSLYNFSMKSCMCLMCACVCTHVVSVSTSVVSQPRWGNVSAAPCLGKPELWVSFARKAVPCRHSDWCIRQPSKAYFEAYWSGDSAVFGSQLSFCAMAISVQWKMAFWFSERNLMAAMRMDLPNVFPSVCLRWNEACSRGLPPNN